MVKFCLRKSTVFWANIGMAIPNFPLRLQEKVYTLPSVAEPYRAPAFVQKKNAEYLSTADPFLNLPPTVFMVP
jgi:hypothetical protein